jgi:tetratricopeptide (TPR) repeat protein
MFVALALVAAACSTAHEKAERATSEAIRLMNAGDFVQARQKMQAAIAERDDSANQWLVLARIDLQLNRPLDALTDYNRVIELDATNAEALQIVSELSFQTGQMTEAISAADRMLALNPGETRALLVKGLVALDRKKLRDAVQYADQLLAISPNDEFGSILKSRVLAINKNFDGARALIEGNVPTAARTEATLLTLLEISRAQGNIATLTSDYGAIIALRPKDVPLKLEFAQFLYKIGDGIKARALLFDLISANANSVDVMRDVLALWIEADSDAVSSAQLASLAKSGSLTVRIGISRYLFEQGRAADVIALLAPVASSSGAVGSNDARALYATALQATGKGIAAKSIIDDILKTDRTNNDALLLRSRFAFARGDLATALGDAQIVITDDPQNRQALTLTRDIFTGRGETLRAMQSYESAIRDAPLSITIVRDYGALLRTIQNKARGLSVAREFTIRSPASVAGWNNYIAQCQFFSDQNCATVAVRGRESALRNFKLDKRPGGFLGRGLFGAIS